MSTTAQLTPLHAVPDDGAVDRDRAITAVADLLRALGRDLAEPDLADTPRRVVDGLLELISPQPFTMTTFPNEDGYDDLVLVRDIPFVSLCRHHLLPFRGTASVGYLPGERLVGLSKLARTVELHARDLQVQETLTMRIADALDDELSPRGLGVVLRAEHLCMSLRGVRSAGAVTETTAFRGVVATDRGLRERFALG